MNFNRVIFKSFISILIAFISASVVIYNIGPLFAGFTGIFLFILSGFLGYFLLKKLESTENPTLSTILFILSSLFIGLFFGNGIIVTIYYMTSLFGDISSLIDTAVLYAALGTGVATIGGIIYAPKMNFKNGIGVKIINVAFIMLVGFSAIYSIGFIFALIGMDTLWAILIELMFGVGVFGIILSALFVAISAYILLATIRVVYDASQRHTPKYKENYFAVMLASSIIELFVDLFRLVLKLLILSKD